MKNETDSRVKKHHFSFTAFILTFAVFAFLSTGELTILGNFMIFPRLPTVVTGMVIGYWLTVSAVFCLFIHAQIKNSYDKPLRKFSKAAKQVAEGDFSVYLTPLHTGSKTDYIDVMFMDFNTMVEELSSIETMKTGFIADVSHEIKTPLSVIQNYAQALQDDSIPPETKEEYTAVIIAASKRLTALITDILKLNKLENQQIQISTQRYDVCRQIEDCALAFESVWESKGISFEADIEDRAYITADESLVALVWNNLLSNAFKYTEKGGHVTLHQTSDEDSVTVTVSDSGCGMNAETLKHIFDQFYQGDTSHSQEGNGLGLALVQKALRLCGGKITVQSENGKGSSFTVTLPV